MACLTELVDRISKIGVVVTNSDIQSWTDRSNRTVRRWYRNGCPLWAVYAITRAAGVIEAKTARGLETWRILDDGTVFDESATAYNIGELRTLTYLRAAARNYRRRAIAAEIEQRRIVTEKHRNAVVAANDSLYLPHIQR